jgi:hypothetical protein
MELFERKKKMKKTITVLVVMLVALSLIGCKKTTPTEPVAKETAVETKEKVVGVYDSRAIALAYWQEEVDGKERFYNYEALGMKDVDLGVLMHQQVFSYHKPVQALEHIADNLPEVMEQAGVDVIVSKWDKEELAKYNIIGSGWDGEFAVNNPNVVDVTNRLVQLYNPTAKFLKEVEGFKNSTPEPLDTDWLHAEE